MKLLRAKSFWESVNKLAPGERLLCHKAITLFRRNPRHPGLNFEHLGQQSSCNHHSIRASRDIRIIIGVEPKGESPKTVIFVHAGHHDPAYEWSNRHNGHTDMKTGISFFDDAEDGGQAQRINELDSLQDWQLRLVPQQEELAYKIFPREARILGAAGTGKTVLALHRVKLLEERYKNENIIVTTFVRSLTNYYTYLYESIFGMHPNVEFINIDRLAFRIVKETVGNEMRKPYGMPYDEDELFHSAWEKTIANTVLAKLPKEYLMDEIKRVIKGRDATKEEYLDTGNFQREGRVRRFQRLERELCWNLKEEWDSRIEDAGYTTFADIMIDARDTVREEGGRYRSVIADEYQDLTLVGAQFLRALVAGQETNPVPEDGLLLLGDVAQRIYPGGWRPAWAELRFPRGRAAAETTLRTNYRNTRLIVEAASVVRGTGKTGADTDEQITDYESFALGDGERPVFFLVGKKQEVPTIIREINRLVSDKSLAYEDVGILVHHTKQADQIKGALNNASIPCFLLKEMRVSTPKAGVRVGTFDRGKGMEFQAVFLPRLGNTLFPEKFEPTEPTQETLPGDDFAELSDEERERRQLQIDRLYVGMTRAIHYLYLVADEVPCDEIENARDYFDWK